jgi:hypothetical protein
MGCKVMRGETIYFLLHGGPASAAVESGCALDERDVRMLPPVYTNSEGRAGFSTLSVIPIDVEALEPV